jgi:hypothetical protein
MPTQKLEPGEYSIPEFIRVDDGWALAEYLTVKMWRKALQTATTDDAKHTALQFRAATQMLELAQEYGLPDDALVIPTLLSNGGGYSENLQIVEGADGIWRHKSALKPALQLVPQNSA